MSANDPATDTAIRVTIDGNHPLPDSSVLREEIANNRRRWNEARGDFDAWLKICEREKARVKGREAK